jgi:hypothetical protein
MTPDQTVDLGILRRPLTAADAIPSSAKFIANPSSAQGIGEDGANLGLARLAQESAGIAAWVMPANAGLICLIVAPVGASSPYQAGGPGCRPATAASQSAQQACDGPNCNDTVPPGQTVTEGDLQTTLAAAGQSSDLPVYIAGVVPDGVSAVTLTLYGGATESIPVQNNVYMTTLRPTGGYLPVYANLGESPPPASAPPTATISFNGPTGEVTVPFGAQGPLFALDNGS